MIITEFKKRQKETEISDGERGKQHRSGGGADALLKTREERTQHRPKQRGNGSATQGGNQRHL